MNFLVLSWNHGLWEIASVGDEVNLVYDGSE